MSVIGSNILAGASGQGGDYTIARSLRFRSSASAYLNRTFTTPTDNKKWTWSAWVKLGTLSTGRILFCADIDANNRAQLQMGSGNNLAFDQLNAGNFDGVTSTVAVYRDPSAWYHVVFVFDSANATASLRNRYYINGIEQAYNDSVTIPQNTASKINSAVSHKIGRNTVTGFQFDGYMAEQHFIDGQALDPSSFGANNASTGVWQPKKYAGTYGTNGFYLPFSDNASTTTLGSDSSGNGNNWTTNNISLTAGSTYDSMTDVPTLTSATASNFAVMNPLDKSSNVAISNANLTTAWGSSSIANIRGTFALPTTGKYYWEALFSGTSQGSVGVAADNMPLGSVASGTYISYAESGLKYVNGSSSAYGSTYGSGDLIGIAYDADASQITFYKNNTSQGAISLTANTTYFPLAVHYNTTINHNFGQRPFAYTPPTGFVALNTFNLPTPTIGATASTQANKNFDATLFTSAGTSDVNVVNAGGFAPDLVWYKDRSTGSTWHTLVDRVRGNNLTLSSNQTDQEYNILDNGYTGRKLVLNSNGFTLNDAYNAQSPDAIVGWQWKANGAGSTNTAGSITSTVSANTSAGFSVVTFTSPASGTCSVGHGLGVKPSMVIVKCRSVGNSGWFVWHQALGDNNTDYLMLHSTAAEQSYSTMWGTVGRTSTLLGFTQGGTLEANATHVAYAFSEVAGYSKFGSYTGNGSSDGPMVVTGFRPKYVMIKSSTNSTYWYVYDSVRNTFNLTTQILYPNLSNAEATGVNSVLDFVSNGFKIRDSGAGELNISGATFIYAAFAETPFKYSLAR